MSQNLYCTVKQKQGSTFVKVVDFNHLSYYTRDLFDRQGDSLKHYDLNFPIIEMENKMEAVNGIEYGYQFIELPYYKVENIINHLELIKSMIEKKLDFLGNYKINEDDRYTIEEDYNMVKNAAEELKYCLLYCKFDLEDTNTIFEFYIK